MCNLTFKRTFELECPKMFGIYENNVTQTGVMEFYPANKPVTYSDFFPSYYLKGKHVLIIEL